MAVFGSWSFLSGEHGPLQPLTEMIAEANDMATEALRLSRSAHPEYAQQWYEASDALVARAMAGFDRLHPGMQDTAGLLAMREVVLTQAELPAANAEDGFRQ